MTRCDASRPLCIAFLVAIACLYAACGGGSQPSANRPGTGASSNSNSTGNKNSNQAPSVVTKQLEPKGGSIQVTSNPTGATVLLVPEDAAGALPPQRKGSTPITILGLAPGKYAVHLEKPGYTYFQKEVEIKGEEAVKVDAHLRKG